MLLTLKTFSLTGGIEKVCRSLAYSLQKLHDEQAITFQMIALYDDAPDERYISPDLFEGYQKNTKWGMFKALQKGSHKDILILSHINLAPIGLMVKILNPTTRVILWTHGIEVWRPINWIKKIFLKKTNQIIAVSQFTSNSLKEWHQVDLKKVKVIHNALDPFFEIPKIIESDYLQLKYNIPSDLPVFMALTRLSASEKNKNYDQVIKILGEIKKEGNVAYYLLCGKYDEVEHQRIKNIAKEAGMENEVILSGFVADDELKLVYQSADAFVLPSTKEGFGLVFMEAQSCGLRVLAGNQDGSPEAIHKENGSILIDPSDNSSLKAALKKLMALKSDPIHKQAIQDACLQNFNFNQYHSKISKLISS